MKNPYNKLFNLINLISPQSDELLFALINAFVVSSSASIGLSELIELQDPK